MFKSILARTPFQLTAEQEARELALKYNHNHDDGGRFSDESHAASRSGHHDTTNANSYGITGSRHKAMTNPRTSRAGKEESKIHREHADQAVAEDTSRNRTRGRSTHDALYMQTTHTPEGTHPKIAQAVKHSHTVTAGRDATAKEDYRTGNDSAVVSSDHARHLLTGLKTKKSVTLFQSQALNKSKDQGHRQITNNIDKKAFKNIDALHDHLEKHGLSDAIVSKTDDGYKVIHRMSNAKHKNGTAAGRAKQRKVMEFRRSIKPEHISTDHHSGTKEVFSNAKQHKELKKFAAANPDHAVSQAYKDHVAANPR